MSHELEVSETGGDGQVIPVSQPATQSATFPLGSDSGLKGQAGESHAAAQQKTSQAILEVKAAAAERGAHVCNPSTQHTGAGGAP